MSLHFEAAYAKERQKDKKQYLIDRGYKRRDCTTCAGEGRTVYVANPFASDSHQGTRQCSKCLGTGELWQEPVGRHSKELPTRPKS